MKKTVKVSLGGFAHTLEEDAYTLLDGYLQTLKSRFANDKEGSDIIRDIEDRISELIAENKGKEEAISIDTIREILQKMGEPEEFSSENVEPKSYSTGPRKKRRLYRDADHSYIGGVCSGLGEYFATDPIVLRILFLVLLFVKGFGLILYLILWIAVPKAVSPRQKLEMKGEPVNLSNIEKTVREEYSEVDKTIQRRGFAGFLDRFFNVLGKIAYAFIRILLYIIKTIAIILAAVIIISMLVLLFTLVGILFFGGFFAQHIIPDINGFSIGDILTSMFDFSSGIWVTIPLFLVIAIPILTFLYLGIRIIFRFKIRDAIIGFIAAITWAAAVVFLSLVIFYQVKGFTIRQQVNEKITLAPQFSKGALLRLESTNLPDTLYSSSPDKIMIDDYSIFLQNGKPLIYGKPSLTIGKSETEYPILEISKRARGGTSMSAKEYARRIFYNYELKDSVLKVDSYFFLPEGEKWKIQEVDLSLNLPEGYTVFIDKSMEEILSHHQPYTDYWPDEMVNKWWVMKGNSLKPKE